MNAASTCAASPTSAATKVPPSRVASADPSCSSTSTMQTCIPSAAKRSAVARPMPDAPPVTSADGTGERRQGQGNGLEPGKTSGTGPASRWGEADQSKRSDAMICWNPPPASGSPWIVVGPDRSMRSTKAPLEDDHSSCREYAMRWVGSVPSSRRSSPGIPSTSTGPRATTVASGTRTWRDAQRACR